MAATSTLCDPGLGSLLRLLLLPLFRFLQSLGLLGFRFLGAVQLLRDLHRFLYLVEEIDFGCVRADVPKE